MLPKITCVPKTAAFRLGMSVVKGFTELMGVILSIESELGHGSCFEVEIPFRKATPKQRDSVLKRAVENDHLDEFEGCGALLAEDNELNAEIAIELLQSLGFVVDRAENGKAACERFESSKVGAYSVVFMDMRMPLMDGIDATRFIRESDRPDNTVPIFAMTANAFVSDRDRCAAAGMTGFISKPIDVDEIAAVLKDAIK